MSNLLRNILAVAMLVSIIGCGAKTTNLNSRLKNVSSSDRPSELVIMPAEVEISRFTAGGAVEEVPELSEASEAAFKTAINKSCSEAQ